MSYYYPMIKSVFEEEEKYYEKNGTDDIGEWYLFQYPGADLNRYYYNHDLLIGGWTKLSFTKFALIRSYVEQTHKYIIQSDGKYYLIGNKVDVDGEEKRFRLIDSYTRDSHLIIEIYGSSGVTFEKEKNIKTERAFKSFLNKVSDRTLMEI